MFSINFGHEKRPDKQILKKMQTGFRGVGKLI